MQLELSLAESWPWPGLVVRAAARHEGQLVRIRRLIPQGGAFRLNGARLDADPVDAWIVRTLAGLPSEDGVAFRAEGGCFAPVLALLRKSSPHVQRRESSRVAACAVLSRPPWPALALEAFPAAEAGLPLRIRARPSFRHPDIGTGLGWPRRRDAAWWLFDSAAAPAPEALPGDALREVFIRGERIYEGPRAWELLRAALDAGAALSLTLPPELAALAAARPPRPVLRLEAASGDGAGPIQAGFHFELAAGKPGGPGGPGESDGATAVSFSAGEILEAARRGQGALQRNGVCCRVDERTAALAREAQQRGAKGSAARGRFRVENEAIPELLSWARARQADPESPWNVYVSEAVAGAHKVEDDPAELRLRLDLQRDGSETWFTVEPFLHAAGRNISAEELRRLLQQRKKWLRSGKRWVRFDPSAWRRFRRQALRHGLQAFGAGAFRFRAEAREKVRDLFSLAGTVEHSGKYRAFLERLESFERIEPLPPPMAFRVALRSYQVKGYQWLRFLDAYGLNGILADEMGLGKTAQTLALLSALRDQRGPWPSLIVCPTSLLDNWRAEARKFDPRLRVMRYQGTPARRDALRRRVPETDLVLTSYGTARNDAALLKKEQWRYLILDEAHLIKNAAAATSKAVKTIPARRRLALTGTPVQNRLNELWSLFDFLMPGFLGRYAPFARRYEEPIVKGQAPEAGRFERRESERAAEALRARIRPFVLRRLRTEVAKDLPAKIQQDVPCRLTAEQVALYRTFAQSDEAQSAVCALEAKGAARAQAQILTALGGLRKVCNHPDLVYLSDEIRQRKRIVPLPGYEKRSGKLAVLAELLDQCRAGGHRALLFCQLTSMLDILEHFLEARGERRLRLDGSTRPSARQGLVDRFNADPSLLVFLISTRAGGSGLNLTGADSVIFYDHDWNPANDRQAQDRAYRIGQTRPVTVYRLVTQGTLEEKILERQARKQKLADAVVRPGAAGFRNLSREELLSLFRFTPPEGSAPA